MKEQIQEENLQEIVEPEAVIEESKEISSDNESEGKTEEGADEEQESNDYYKDKYYDTKSKVRKIYAERQKLYNENQQIKELYRAANIDNLIMSYDLMKSDLDKIKLHKEEARKAGDTKHLDLADDAYNRILHRMVAFERENSHLFIDNNDVNENTKSAPVNEEDDVESPYNEEQIIAANIWLEEHPELNVKSRSYNPNLEKKMIAFIEEFNDKLYEAGRGDEIFSDPYVEVLNEAKLAYMEESRKPKTSYKKSGASGVRSNMATKSGDSISIEPWERSAMQTLGLTEAEYLKSKLKNNRYR
jgi:hypothetical protein